MDRKFWKVFVCAALTALVGLQAFAQTPKILEIDLATMDPDVVAKRPGGRDLTYDSILIKNAIPRFIRYGVDIAVTDVVMPPLSLGAFGSTHSVGQRGGQGADDPCQVHIDNLLDKLDEVTEEKNVPGIGAAAVVAAEGQPCKKRVWDEFTARTQQPVAEKLDVKSYQTVTIIISRPGAVYTLELTGKARGEWRTSYGFFFVPDRDERYFVEETPSSTAGQPSTFKIRKQDDREEFDFVPTIVFTFFPNGGASRGGIWGATAGLGYDLEKPFVFAGGSYAYNENVIFTGGVAFHRQSRLLGKYDTEDGNRSNPGQMLEPGQLVEDTYGPNVYVGVSFRFGEDIHAKRNELEAATAKANAAVAAARVAAKTADDESKVRKAECIARAEAAAAIAKAADDCKTDVCIKKVEAEEAAAKAKCPLTEIERAKAEKEANDKKAAADEAVTESRKACQDAAKSAFDAASATCKAADDCKADANDAAKKKCAVCTANAQKDFDATKAKCLNP